MVYIGKPQSVELFDNRKTRYTAAKVKAVTGTDIVFNGGLFNMKTLEPYCDIKANGVVLCNDQYGYEGMGWNKGNLPHYALTADMPQLDNFFSCVWAVTNGKAVKMIYPPDMGGVRGRTAWGFTATGEIVIICTSDVDGAMTMERAQNTLISHGCVIGVINDCGGSCQCETPSKRIVSSRIVSNFVVVKLNITDKIDTIVNDKKEDDTLNIIQPNYKWAYGATIRTKTTHIVLHHVGVVGNFTPEQIHTEHLRKGWRGIAYNYYIRKDGTVYHGREENAAGGHTLDYNLVSIGICFEGNFEVEKMPLVQREAGQALVADILTRYPTAKVVRHRDLNKTACPGANFPFTEITTAPATTTTQPKNIIYRVQVGSFTDETNAEQLVTELSAKGYKPYITTEVKA